MKVSLKWLREYVDLGLPPEEVAERLTMVGLEVTGVTRVGGAWDNITVGRVVEVAPHPNADRLRLATVDTGSGRTTVVCGAPNLRVGDKVPFARPGARLIDPHTGKLVTIEPVRIRGILSEGMICSEKELGISERHEGIMVLPEDAPLGAPLAEYLGDLIWEIDVTPNRPDCLSILGIAREVAAVTGKPVREPSFDYPEAGPPIEELTSVEILDPDLCPRYCAGVILDIHIAPSPPWLQERLLSYGMRPINNVVDVTNYVMLEVGQPLHAFDLETLEEKRIVVRRAYEGERVVTIDGVERELSPEILAIADAKRAVAVAGVMGGEATEVTPGTRAILLEAANFNYANIRQTSSRLKLRTEASLRFEKGLNPELAFYGLRRAMKLILELAGGQACQGIIDVYPGRSERKPIMLVTEEVKRLLGLEVSAPEVERVLKSLGFECREVGPSQFEVFPPYWRSDVHLPADLVEEVARIVGYDRIPMTMLRGEVPQQRPDPVRELKEDLRRLMVGFGFQEVITYSLVSGEKLRRVGSPLGLKVVNPLSHEQEYLRTSLRPGLLMTAALNLKHSEGVRIFEVGRVYLSRPDDLPEEREMLGCLLGGRSGELSWADKGRELDFFDAKGVVEGLLSRLNIKAEFRPVEEPWLIRGRQAAVCSGGHWLGVLGEVHPEVVEFFDISVPVFFIELDLPALLPVREHRHYRPLPRFPAGLRDISIIVDAGLPAGRIVDVISAFPLVSEVQLFDLYTGPPVPEGKKSLAFRLFFRSPEKTLSDAEIEEILQEIVSRLASEFGATLRGPARPS